MKRLALILCLMWPSGAVADIFEPKTKYMIGQCLQALDKSFSWYGKKAKVYDIIHSRKWRAYVYVLEIGTMIKRKEYAYIEMTDARSLSIPC